MRVAALGRTKWLYDGVGVLISAGHEIVIIGTCEASAEYEVDEADFESLASEIGCRFFCDGNINSKKIRALLAASRAEAAVSVNWPTIIQRQTLDLFDHGVINGHAGDLPRFRGNACPNWALIAGEKNVVISLHKMVEELDAGPILLQKAMAIEDSTYIGDVYRFIADSVPGMFVEAVNGLEAGTVTEREQTRAPASSLRCYPRRPNDGLLRWDRDGAEGLVRLVRASAEPFSGAYSFLEGSRLVVWRAHREDLPYPYLGVPGQVVEVRRATGEAVVLAQEGAVVLEVVELEKSGRVPAADVISSTRTRVGMDFAQELLNIKASLDELRERLKREG